MIDKNELEAVQGISRFYEMLWIRRDADGRIQTVYDNQLIEVDLTELHKSFITVACDGGFTYRGEFIPMKDENSAFKKRALNLQRRKRNHPPDTYL